MTIRPITPPPGANRTEWHAARDAEVRADERKAVLLKFLDLASGLELANADDADGPAQDFCRGVRSAGRRLSKLIDKLVTP